ncbi:AAA family ATPase [Streptomyces sp. T-3]|nr:AAA family ATPase [Streptomyces sp. T-3]
MRNPSGLVEQLSVGRVLTLVGPPGVGKSYLADRVARAGQLPVQRVDLSECRDPAQVPQAVADAVGADVGHSTDPLPGLLRALAPQHGLLVLDTCEHVRAGCVRLVGQLLDACPKMQLLATSRRPLDMPDEKLVDVRPMTLEQTEDLLQEQAAVQGVELDRAWAHLFARRIDGDPLSVVLVAHGLRHMGARQLFARLSTPGGRFAVLTDGPLIPARHRTLWRAVEWSHQLCGRRERLLWTGLSAFSGTFTRDQVQLLFDGRGELDLLVRSSIVQAVSADHFRLPLAHREFGQLQLGALSGLYGADDE